MHRNMHRVWSVVGMTQLSKFCLNCFKSTIESSSSVEYCLKDFPDSKKRGDFLVHEHSAEALLNLCDLLINWTHRLDLDCLGSSRELALGWILAYPVMIVRQRMPRLYNAG